MSSSREHSSDDERKMEEIEAYLAKNGPHKSEEVIEEGADDEVMALEDGAETLLQAIVDGDYERVEHLVAYCDHPVTEDCIAAARLQEDQRILSLLQEYRETESEKRVLHSSAADARAKDVRDRTSLHPHHVHIQHHHGSSSTATSAASVPAPVGAAAAAAAAAATLPAVTIGSAIAVPSAASAVMQVAGGGAAGAAGGAGTGAGVGTSSSGHIPLARSASDYNRETAATAAGMVESVLLDSGLSRSSSISPQGEAEIAAAGAAEVGAEAESK